MAFLRLRHATTLILLLCAAATSARAADQLQATAPGLYDRPVLAIDPGIHTATIMRASADVEGRWAVTGSYDKTVRVWSLADGALLRTIRLPAGPANVGMAYAVVMSPDGALIAVGGWTRWTESDRQEQIYIFDRESGALVRRIEGLPQGIGHLAFSADGGLLAATLARRAGLRVYARERDWAEVARDVAYGNDSYGVDFAPDGRLATTALDGKVRLYSGDLKGSISPVATAAPVSRPYGVAFSPTGPRLAVGDLASATVVLLDGRTLAPLSEPNLRGIAGGNLSKVAWSRDGGTLFAAGEVDSGGRTKVFTWSDAGAGMRRALLAGQNTIESLVPLPEGDLLIAAADPWLARLQLDGGTQWIHGPPNADFRNQERTLSVSNDGTVIDFGFAFGGEKPARFNLAARALSLDPPRDGHTTAPLQHDLPVGDWRNTTRPTLAGKPLRLAPDEVSRSLAFQPSGAAFVLGANWTLRAFGANGTPLWSRATPGAAWAVNITGDGRLVVAAYSDGTIRWHRMADGVELLAFMPLPDHTGWVVWTPEGFYAATAGAHGALRWHVNRGWDKPADSVAIGDIPGSYRPDVMPLVLQELETPRALGLATLTEHRREVTRRTHSGLAPGARLHLLAIGISDYNQDYAKQLHLNYAEHDARDLASALVNTQDRLYAQVLPQMLPDKEATKAGILRALAAMRSGLERGGGNDLAIVHFSGHGALIDGKLYLLPYDVDARDVVGIKTGALSIDDLKGELLELAKRGRVLVLLDACHSGATTMDGATLDMDSSRLRTEIAAANVTVLTSSSGQQISREDPAWGHGAFTKTLLDALNDPAADIDRTGLISTSGLARYLAQHVPSLTGGAQTPGMEVRYETTVLASGF